MSLRDQHLACQATLAPDGIPLHYGDLKAEYHAALHHVVLMDRSHEHRLELSGKDRLALVQRMSTNDVLNMGQNEGRATIFTNPNGRILDRVTIHNRAETALLITEPGRGNSLLGYLQRHIFFNDDVRLADRSSTTHLFALHGPQADAIMDFLAAGSSQTPPLWGIDVAINGVNVFATRRKPVSGLHWALVVPADQAEVIWTALLETRSSVELLPAGSLVYNALRIRAGRPAVGRELSEDYIPLEAGLWDEVSFTKGCYTGQEIIARMESRNRLAKTLVTVRLEAWVEAPTTIYSDGRSVGTLTSSVITPDGERLGVGFVKPALAIPGQRLTVADASTGLEILTLAGVQPPQLADLQSD